ncbi:unnamed protein product [Acanthosepion pharaonis]|uniref:Uncharacterized protein n=1 Tax=Acanthosepion pharaonis TaxID=158019 RepID=A0A812D0I8_ACAPH|nr:unnamed protein product [Sepia pharaonis]
MAIPQNEEKSTLANETLALLEVIDNAFSISRLLDACTFYCDDSSCLSDKLLVCNGKSDCVDQSDEQNCNEREDTSPAPTEQPLRSNSNIMPIIVIIIIVVCILGVIIFGLCHCHISSWMCQGDDSRNRTPEHENLHPSSQTNFSEDLSGIPAQEQRAIAQFKEKQTRLKSIRTDMELGLPPSIPISEDGEEGYVTSQRLLQSCERSHKADCQAFCPPPNRTIRNGESPSSLCHAHSTPNSSFLGLSTHKQATLPTSMVITYCFLSGTRRRDFFFIFCFSYLVNKIFAAFFHVA